MKVLVTGGAGFIGSHTVDALVNDGFDVRILDNLEEQVHHGKKPDYINTKAEFVLGDIKDVETWEKCLKGVDAVIHLAAMTGIGQSMYEPSKYLSSNIVGTSNFYKVLVDRPDIRKNIKKIIMASSKTIYGEGAYKCATHGVVYPGLRLAGQLKKKDWELRCPVCNKHIKPVKITEDKPPQNLSIYAVSKYVTERMGMMYGEVFGIPTTVFRYFSVYGPRQSLSNPYTGICSIFLCRVKNNKPPIIFEDGQQIRDFVFVEDVANVNLQVLKKAKTTDVYNIGTGTTTTVCDVADEIIDILGVDIKPVVTQESRVGDTRHDFADISKAEKHLGFKPKRSFKEGLNELVKWSETKEAVDMFERAEKERKVLQS